MYILRRLSVFFSSWANIDILHVDSRLLWIETWFIQPLGLVILAAVFPVLQQPGPRWLCRWRADSRPRCGPKRGGAARSGLHLPPRTQNPSFSLLTHQVKVIRTRPGLPFNSPFGDPWPPNPMHTFWGPNPRSTWVRVTLWPLETHRWRKHFFIQNSLMQEWRRMLQCPDSSGCQRTKTRRTPLQWVAFGFSGAVGQNELILQ